jgi:hypothetical protein
MHAEVSHLKSPTEAGPVDLDIRRVHVTLEIVVVVAIGIEAETVSQVWVVFHWMETEASAP